MPWSSLAGNQSVSDTNLKDAVDNGIFPAGGTSFPSPTQNKEVTKSRASGYINIPNSGYAPFAVKADNEIITKDDIYVPGDFRLDPQYAKVFTSMTGTNLPSFSFNVASPTTIQYNGVIPAQNIAVSLTGNAVVSPIRVSLYVNSVLIQSVSIAQNGATSATLTLPNDVPSPNEIRIAVDSGNPPAPSTFTFGNNPVNNVAVSKNTGQYQIASIGTFGYQLNLPRFAVEGGYLCYSSDYGANWYTSNITGTFSKIAISHDGAYALAVSQSGYAYRSTNGGSSWTAITSLGSRVWSGCSCSETGQYMIMTARISSPYNSGAIYVSSDYGATWTSKVPSGVGLGDYSSCTIGIDFLGQSLMEVTEYAYPTNTTDYFSSEVMIYKSTNLGSTFSAEIFNVDTMIVKKPIPKVFEIRRSPDKTRAILLFTSFTFSFVYIDSYDGQGFEEFAEISNNFYINGTVNSTGNDVSILCFQTGLAGGGAAYLRKTTDYTTYTDITAAGSRVWQCVDIDNWDTTNKYILAGSTSGLYRSNDGGATFTSL